MCGTLEFGLRERVWAGAGGGGGGRGGRGAGAKDFGGQGVRAVRG